MIHNFFHLTAKVLENVSTVQISAFLMLVCEIFDFDGNILSLKVNIVNCKCMLMKVKQIHLS